VNVAVKSRPPQSTASAFCQAGCGQDMAKIGRDKRDKSRAFSRLNATFQKFKQRRMEFSIA
jgi:hypothetical protein